MIFAKIGNDLEVEKGSVREVGRRISEINIRSRVDTDLEARTEIRGSDLGPGVDRAVIAIQKVLSLVEEVQAVLGVGTKVVRIDIECILVCYAFNGFGE